MNNRANLEGRILCRTKNSAIVPYSYCIDICPSGGDCGDRKCSEPQWDSWQLRSEILELKGIK